LVYAGVKQQEIRNLTPEEITKALQEAKEKGLTDGWTVE